MLNDVKFDLDLTDSTLTTKDEVVVGSKVTVLRVGQVTTDVIATGVTNPGAGRPAYLAANGQFRCCGC